MPYFNAEKTIRATLSSLLESSRPPDEIIIVDDGSTPESGASLSDTVRELSDKSITIVTLSANHGGGYARNAGIHTSSGENIFMLDSDNLVSLSLLELLIDAKASSPPEAHVFAPEQFVFFEGDSQTISKKWVLNQTPLTPEQMLRYAPTPGASGNYLFSKESWARSGGYPTKSESLDTWGFGFRQLVAGYSPTVTPGTHYFHLLSPDSYWLRDARDTRAMSVRATALILESVNKIDPSIVSFVMSRRRASKWYSKMQVPDFAQSKTNAAPGYQVTRDDMLPDEVISLEQELKRILIT